MRKFQIIALAMLASLPTFSLFTPSVIAPSVNAAEVAGLENTLMNGLRAQRPSDRAFVKKVVSYVAKDKLQRKLVMEVFQYVRKKISPQRRAVIFQLLVKRRAKAVNVTI